ncbi:hypothetical protein Hanom_Chr13g01201601 [Helianthus anomalus]
MFPFLSVAQTKQNGAWSPSSSADLLQSTNHQSMPILFQYGEALNHLHNTLTYTSIPFPFPSPTRHHHTPSFSPAVLRSDTLLSVSSPVSPSVVAKWMASVVDQDR